MKTERNKNNKAIFPKRENRFFAYKKSAASNAADKTISNICSSFIRFKINMAEEEGFEPPRALTPLSVFKTDPFSQTWVFLRICGGPCRTRTYDRTVMSRLL